MSDEYFLDPVIWFTDRELPYKPKHFVSVNTPVNTHSKHWIVNTLKGRYFFEERVVEGDFLDFGNKMFPAFEDPAEAVLYELRWS